jgi:hypothetical protein
MQPKTRIFTILTALNLLVSVALGFWVYSDKKTDVLTIEGLECLLEELSRKNPQLFVYLLNNSANSSAKSDAQILESAVFKNRAAILKSGFFIKKYQTDLQRILVVFSDMTCPHCIAFLKNVDTALPNINCSIVIIPISILGEKATYQAQLITAASLQDVKKAFKLLLLYKAFEGSENNMMRAAEKIGLDVVKLSQAIDSKAVAEVVNHQTKIAEDLKLPGVPSMFLLTSDAAYFLPPVEAKDIPNLIDNPSQEENE